MVYLTASFLKLSGGWGKKGTDIRDALLCMCAYGGRRSGKRLDRVCKGFDGGQIRPTHPLASPPRRDGAFPSLRLFGSSSVSKTTPLVGFLENFAATSRPLTEGDGEEFPTSSFASPTTCFGSGSSAPLPPQKYKSRKSPKHTAITATLPWIRMVRATCYGWHRQAGPLSWLRV